MMPDFDGVGGGVFVPLLDSDVEGVGLRESVALRVGGGVTVGTSDALSLMRRVRVGGTLREAVGDAESVGVSTRLAVAVIGILLVRDAEVLAVAVRSSVLEAACDTVGVGVAPDTVDVREMGNEGDALRLGVAWVRLTVTESEAGLLKDALASTEGVTETVRLTLSDGVGCDSDRVTSAEADRVPLRDGVARESDGVITVEADCVPLTELVPATLTVALSCTVRLTVATAVALADGSADSVADSCSVDVRESDADST